MWCKKALIVSVLTLSAISGFLAATSTAFAISKETVLYSFNGADGQFPSNVTLTADSMGNLYGTTSEGGNHGLGTVFKLTKGANGEWTETILYSFCPGGHRCVDGELPDSGLVFDAVGNLYGTTGYGGASECNLGCGTVFELMPGANGHWREKVLYSFQGDNGDGQSPSGVNFDAAGNLYGTTFYGGGDYAYCVPSCGTVFQLTHHDDGTWTEKVLHRFNSKGKGKDGSNPDGSLTIDALGNLYGITTAGGTYICGSVPRCGTVFEISPGTNGKWAEKILHSFNGLDGEAPYANVVFDAAGNLYGTTYKGGEVGCGPPSGCGTVFELISDADGKWSEKVLHSFFRERGPVGGVIFDGAGNLYGTTVAGGAYGYRHCLNGCGTVFELSPGKNGQWSETTLHDFNIRNGWEPTGNLIFDAAGNLYGTTVYGGTHDTKRCRGGACGTVFEIRP